MTSSAGAHAPFDSRDVHVGQDVAGRDVTVAADDVARYRAGTGGDDLPADTVPALLYHSEVLPRPVVVPAEPDRQPARAPGVAALPPDARRRRRALARHGRRALPQAQRATTSSPRCCWTTPDGRWLQRSRTHQSFLAERAGGGRRGRQGPRAPRRSSLRPAGRRRRASGAARAHGHARDVRGLLGPEPQLPHRSRDGAGARLPRHRRAGNDLGVLRRRRDGAALRRRLACTAARSTSAW